MGEGGKDVLVTDESWAFLDSTRKGKARKLLKSGKAVMLAKDPPFIQLRKTVSVKEKEGKKMSMVKSIDQYFREQAEIYIQNISGGVVSLTFYENDGRVEPFSLPNDRRPVRLTDYIPKEIVIKSPDFRKLIMRRPPAIRLLSDEEYYKTIKTIATETGKDVEKVVDEISEKLTKVQTHTEMKIREEDEIKMVEQEVSDSIKDGTELDIPGEADSGISPRVLQLVGNCSKQAELRMKADDALAELATLNLSIEDLNYIVSNCDYKTVVVWAKKKLREIEKGSS